MALSSRKKNLLLIAIGFLPNIGGLETHLSDLIDELIKKQWQVTVLTYQPLHTPVKGMWIERKKGLVIYRLPTFRGLFYRLLNIPVLEFLFLEPLLFLVTPILLLRNPEVRVVNAQGVIAGFAAAFWTKIIKIKYIISVQSVYNFPKKGIFRTFCKRIFKSADKIIAISDQAKKDVVSLGIDSDKVIVYTNWENPRNYPSISKIDAKKKLSLNDKFIVSFFGRLVKEKGVEVLLEAIKMSDPSITFLLYGEGPLKEKILQSEKKYKNLVFMGTLKPQELSLHYSAADLIVMPSLHEEGFGRVASGALYCETPVIASNRGALPEVISNRVGKIIEPTAKEIASALNFYLKHKKILAEQSTRAKAYARKRFSKKNANVIITEFESD